MVSLDLDVLSFKLAVFTSAYLSGWTSPVLLRHEDDDGIGLMKNQPCDG
jgi:hypothetical protein